MDKVVVSVGGSVLIPGNGDSEYIKELADMIAKVSKTVKLAIVCGGGRIARYYTETGKELGASTYQRDLLGIDVTRINARMFSIALGDNASSAIPTEPSSAAEIFERGKIVVMGGTEPGHTTDAVSAMVAREIKANRVINATSVDAVYSDDPKKVKNAERYSSLTIDELQKLVYSDHDAGRSSVFDPLGIRILKEERIELRIVDGRDIVELENAILGKDIKGTIISS